jgi:hypothetical protein
MHPNSTERSLCPPLLSDYTQALDSLDINPKARVIGLVDGVTVDLLLDPVDSTLIVYEMASVT